MKRYFVWTLAAVVIGGAVISCEDDDDPTGPGLETQSFAAVLNGAAEVPANASTATGVAEIAVVGPTLLFRVDVTGLSNPSAAHIHTSAGATENGPVRVNLCGATGVPACPTGTPFTGTLAVGSAVQVSGISYDSLLVLLRNGTAYVNVHTNDGVAPTGTGPGDLSAGEIRGQITVVDDDDD
jgi:hypothetical protein